MKKIDISITKAQLMSFSVDLAEGKPEVHATIGLFTDGGKKISDYSISTNSWQHENKFELPVEALPLLGDVARVLERVVVKHCRDSQKVLPAVTPNEPEAEVIIADPVPNFDEPINLDNIPF